MDIVSDILHLLSLRASVYFHSRLCGHWAINGANEYSATFHLIARGNCWLHIPSKQQRIPLTSVDLLVFPRDIVHSISHSDTTPINEQFERTLASELLNSTDTTSVNASAETSLICGYFDFDSPLANPLLNAMPDVLHIKSEDPGRSSRMNSILRFITTETESDLPGSDSVVDKLSEILFIHVIRAFMQQQESNTGLLAALTHPQINKSIQDVHRRPEYQWSLDSLAAVAGMSRSSYASHFKQLTHITPMQYVTEWRMQLAYERLRSGSEPVSKIAESAGYYTEASFRKAFKQHMGIPPGSVRKLSK